MVGCYHLSSEFTVTTDMHVRYYRQPRGGPLRAEATMVHNGRTLLSAECSVFDVENRVLIRSTATYTRISVQGRAIPAP
ncbi:PaaI family thioesterase [Mycobacterium sp. JS623]|uniref:PaaI family thioesterase n=1 Tax=Mycobacterium sp. JS623 TaxID=212767 RepID=UPI00214E0020|nr:PaaI family thioesterase [Mycobacterium sp. JS623]